MHDVIKWVFSSNQSGRIYHVVNSYLEGGRFSNTFERLLSNYRSELPYCEVKNQLICYHVRWFKYSFCNSVNWRCFKIFCNLANILLHIPLKMGTKWRRFWIHIVFNFNNFFLQHKNIILSWTWGLFVYLFIYFFKCSYSQRCFDFAQRC